MKTAEEILAQVLICNPDFMDNNSHMRVGDALQAMKLYANQKLDEAVSKSFIFSEGTFDEEDKSFKTIDIDVVEKNEILKLKD